MNKVSVSSPSNIALIKYWGMSDAQRTLPNNVSLSMTLRRCVSLYTLAPLGSGCQDEVLYKPVDGQLLPASTALRAGIEQHLYQLRQHFHYWQPLRIATTNRFPTGAGIASSASGFSALAAAFCTGLGLPLDSPDLSELARLSGSGSASRSVLGGFVQWPADMATPSGPAKQLFAAEHWPLCDLIAVVDARHKTVSSRQGHLLAASSPFYTTRLCLLSQRLEAVHEALANRDFSALAEVVELEAMELHMIAMTSQPPIFYWLPATLGILLRVRQLRDQGLEICATIDAGPNVHVLCTRPYARQALAALRTLPGVERWIIDQVGDGPRRLRHHLF